MIISLDSRLYEGAAKDRKKTGRGKKGTAARVKIAHNDKAKGGPAEVEFDAEGKLNDNSLRPGSPGATTKAQAARGVGAKGIPLDQRLAGFERKEGAIRARASNATILGQNASKVLRSRSGVSKSPEGIASLEGLKARSFSKATHLTNVAGRGRQRVQRLLKTGKAFGADAPAGTGQPTAPAGSNGAESSSAAKLRADRAAYQAKIVADAKNIGGVQSPTTTAAAAAAAVPAAASPATSVQGAVVATPAVPASSGPSVPPNPQAAAQPRRGRATTAPAQPAQPAGQAVQPPAAVAPGTTNLKGSRPNPVPDNGSPPVGGRVGNAAPAPGSGSPPKGPGTGSRPQGRGRNVRPQGPARQSVRQAASAAAAAAAPGPAAQGAPAAPGPAAPGPAAQGAPAAPGSKANPRVRKGRPVKPTTKVPSKGKTAADTPVDAAQGAPAAPQEPAQGAPAAPQEPAPYKMPMIDLRHKLSIGNKNVTTRGTELPGADPRMGPSVRFGGFKGVTSTRSPNPLGGIETNPRQTTDVSGKVPNNNGTFKDNPTNHPRGPHVQDQIPGQVNYGDVPTYFRRGRDVVHTQTTDAEGNVKHGIEGKNLRDPSHFDQGKGKDVPGYFNANVPGVTQGEREDNFHGFLRAKLRDTNSAFKDREDPQSEYGPSGAPNAKTGTTPKDETPTNHPGATDAEKMYKIRLSNAQQGRRRVSQTVDKATGKLVTKEVTGDDPWSVKTLKKQDGSGESAGSFRPDFSNPKAPTWKRRSGGDGGDGGDGGTDKKPKGHWGDHLNALTRGVGAVWGGLNKLSKARTVPVKHLE